MNQIVLDACNVYRRFLNEFFKIALLLDDTLRKDEELDWLDPTTEPPNAYTKLKIEICGTFFVGPIAAADHIGMTFMQLHI